VHVTVRQGWPECCHLLVLPLNNSSNFYSCPAFRCDPSEF